MKRKAAAIDAEEVKRGSSLLVAASFSCCTPSQDDGDIKVQLAKAQNQALVTEMHKFKRKIAELEVRSPMLSSGPNDARPVAG